MASSSPDTETRIRAWLNSLSDLTRSGAEAVTAERIATTAAMLAQDGFPGGAFTAASLHHVAQGQVFFPAYDTIRVALHGWWDAHRPKIAPRLDGPDVPADLTVEDRQWLDFYHRRRAEILVPDYVPKRGSVDADLANLASLVRAQSPRAWSVISGRPMPTTRAPTEAEVEAVSRALRPVLGPRSDNAMPADEPPPPPRPQYLEGEALRLSRERRGLVVREGA